MSPYMDLATSAILCSSLRTCKKAMDGVLITLMSIYLVRGSISTLPARPGSNFDADLVKNPRSGRKIRILIDQKRVWALASWRLTEGATPGEIERTARAN